MKNEDLKSAWVIRRYANPKDDPRSHFDILNEEIGNLQEQNATLEGEPYSRPFIEINNGTILRDQEAILSAGVGLA